MHASILVRLLMVILVRNERYTCKPRHLVTQLQYLFHQIHDRHSVVCHTCFVLCAVAAVTVAVQPCMKHLYETPIQASSKSTKVGAFHTLLKS